ncbi:hypothetical protein BDV96DRAFT_98089 [Lophiotrema nucula]|uniref:DNA/RNA-binding domain-containing protein n=1 Tax=Lophiotrema nucula TaxID=690887 RepID=A0A6A5Z7V0_9PLEO|nr:hypothetical protein BDV96DRAFT_98089 [Lophiotrema nucula]
MDLEFAVDKSWVQLPESISKPSQATQPPGSYFSFSCRNFPREEFDPGYPGLPLQPDSRPISQEQLACEVKSIYAGLTMVETKCIHVERAHASAVDKEDRDGSSLGPDHWQALIALHRTLLHEHHDFFLASQHPSASPALKRLAAKYSMPARMWKHGIHSFLELLRRRLPESLDHMLAFIYLAYQMMALLYETVPSFEDTWIECLGDLGRYRMAIDDEDLRDRETWAGIARSWYNKAADKSPSVGRLYHHLAILARPNALQQLYYYARSMTCVRPFASARESILTLLDPILGRASSNYSHASYSQALPIDISFIQAHGVLFEKLHPDRSEEARCTFQSQLDDHIRRVTAKWQEQGVYIAVSNIAGLFDYGSDDSIIRQILQLHVKETTNANSRATEQDPTEKENGLDVSSGFKNMLSEWRHKIRLRGPSWSTPRVLSLLRHRIAGLLSLALFAHFPAVSASAIPVRRSPEGSSPFTDNSVVDYIFTSVILLYLCASYCLGLRARKASLALSLTSAIFWLAMVSEDDSRFTSSSCWNVLKIWAGTTFTFACLTCHASVPRSVRGVFNQSSLYRFLLQLLGISALLQVAGMSMQNFKPGSFLKALPPCLSLGILVTSNIPQQPVPLLEADPERTIGHPDSDRTPQQNTPPAQDENSLPSPSHFVLNDETAADRVDLESLVNSRHQHAPPASRRM